MKEILFFSFLFVLTFQKEEELTFLKEQKEFNLSILTESNFSSLKNNSLILFYSSTCEYCKEYKSFFLSLISKFKDLNYSCEFAVINAAKYKNLSEKNEIKFFPTLKFFFNNKFFFINDRTEFQKEEKIIDYLNKIKNGFVTKITNTENLFFNNKIVLLSTLTEKNSQKNFENLAQKTFDLISFFHCDSEQCEKTFENEIVLFKNNQTKKFSIEMQHKNFSFENIKFFLSNFLVENGAKIPKNFIEILFDYNRTAFVFITNDYNENNDEIKIIKEIFEIYKNRLLFFFLDTNDKIDINKKLLDFFEIDHKKKNFPHSTKHKRNRLRRRKFIRIQRKNHQKLNQKLHRKFLPQKTPQNSRKRKNSFEKRTKRIRIQTNRRKKLRRRNNIQHQIKRRSVDNNKRRLRSQRKNVEHIQQTRTQIQQRRTKKTQILRHKNARKRNPRRKSVTNSFDLPLQNQPKIKTSFLPKRNQKRFQ